MDAYDSKVGDETLAALEAELGELPVTPSSTARGVDSPSRIYFFQVPEGLSFVTRFQDIEIIQHSHRYAMVWPSIHPDTGSQYAWYDSDGEPLSDVPAVDDLERLPEAWLDRLVVPNDERPKDHAGFSGTVAEWLAKVPQGEPGLFIQARMAEIPSRDFGHDEMISLQASFVNLAAQGETGADKALSKLKAEWLRGEYDTPDYARDFDVSLTSAIKKYGALPEGSSDIGNNDAAIALAQRCSPALINLWVKTDAPDARVHVGEVLRAALGEGFTFVEAATLAWNAPAARKDEGIRNAGRGAFWSFCGEAMNTTPAPAAVERVAEPGEPRVRLLTDRERAEVQIIQSTKWPGSRWWGDHFMDVMIQNHSVLSEPYYRLNRWLIPSLVFSKVASVQEESGSGTILNFYMIALGPSNSGKSESLKPILEACSALGLREGGDNPDIGGDATAAALTQALIRRDGLSSLFHSDEADAVLYNWSNQNGEFRGMKQRITDIYGGDVPALQRTTQKDISGIHAKAYLSVHLTGIDERITDAIAPDDWRTGFVNRFIWTEGERKYRTDEMRLLRLRDPDDVTALKNGHQAWTNEWVNRLGQMAERIPRRPGEGLYSIKMDHEVNVRNVETQKALERVAIESGPYFDRVAPTFERYKVYILKCAALVALTEGRTNIKMSDYLIALEQMEEWAETALKMVEATDLTPRARKVNKLAAMIEKRGGAMTKSEIYRENAYAGDFKEAEGLINELKAQRRIEVLAVDSSDPIVRLMKEAA